MSAPRDVPETAPGAPEAATNWRAARQAKLDALRARGIEPYPSAFDVTHLSEHTSAQLERSA
jgi:hypothetical protein